MRWEIVPVLIAWCIITVKENSRRRKIVLQTNQPCTFKIFCIIFQFEFVLKKYVWNLSEYGTILCDILESSL